MPIACIFVPDFSVQAVLRAEPGLRSQPVAVLEGKAPLQKIFALNRNARAMGMEPGMTRLQVEHCTELALRSRSALQECAAHDALLACAQSFSPRVEDAADDTLLLDLAGLESLFGPLASIAQALALRALEFGMEANVAVASNADTAVIGARGFLGVTIIPEGEEAARLGSLPVEVLFVGGAPQRLKPGSVGQVDHGTESALPLNSAEHLLETFERWGVRNLNDLAGLPDIALSERLGQEGIFLQQLARGVISRDLFAVEDLPIFEKEVELEHPLVLLEPLAFLLSQLLEEICARLAAYAFATQELTLRLELADAYFDDAETVRVEAPRRHFTRTLNLPVPLIDARVFLKLLQLDLNANPPGAPIRKIYLAAKPVRPRAAQGGLFLPPAPEPEKLELTLTRIAGIVGGNQVGSLEMLDTHRPEGFRMQRFSHDERPASGAKARLDSHLGGTSETRALPVCSQARSFSAVAEAEFMAQAQPSQGASGLVTALRIFRPPVRAVVTIRDGKPAHITCPKRESIEGEILWTAGPWRSSGDWWEHEGWARDEWDIAVEEKSGIAMYRLVRDLLGGEWVVEGVYD